jgi:DNA-binding SARP family transcriptional activator/predicted ATPase
MPGIRIELLGSFRVTVDGQPVAALQKNRLQSLLAYLVLHRDAAVSREQLAFTLWPDSSESQARTNLRQLIHNLRHALPAECDFLVSDHQTVRWRDAEGCSVDVLEFEDAVARGDRQSLEEAAAVYQDDLLRGSYDEWLEPKREQLRAQLGEALERLTTLTEAAQAVRHAERLVALDPLRESHYRLLMELYARTGDRASALRAYHQCMRVLKRELGVTPGDATRQLFERVLKSDAPAAEPATPRPPSRGSGLPLVGRRKEWEQLRDCWRRAAAGESPAVLLVGEAGIGKSRLADELGRWVESQNAAVARARCHAARQLAYGPVEDWLKSPPLRVARASLTKAQLQELARVCPDVLADDPTLPPPQPLADSWQRRHFYEALRVAVTKAAPLLLAIDDLQWCDQDTIGWLDFLLTSGTRGVMVVGTARPEHSIAGIFEELALGPLDAVEAAALAARVADRDLDAAYLQRLYYATKGNPLFVVESVRAKLEDSGSAEEDVPLSAVPRVQAVIATRLAQLSAGAHELAGVAGAIGTAFSFDLLAKATDWDEESVTRALDELWQRRIVETVEERRGSYDFSHDRLREVAYAELSPVRRRYLHRRIAHALEELHAGRTEAVAGQLGAHCEAAGLIEDAVRWHTEAAAVAQRRYADAEAATLARRALTLCRELPASPARDAQELEVLVLHADALLTAHGYAAAEAEETHHRALEISVRLGETRHRGAILAAAAFFHQVRGELETARQLSEQLAEFATGASAAVKATADFMLGINLYHLGRLAEGRQVLDRAWAACDGAATTLSLFGGLDMRVFSGSYRSHVLWVEGDREGAAAQSAAAVALARREAHPFSLALALDYAALLAVFNRDAATAAARAAEAAEICRKYAFLYYLAWSRIVSGWARAQQGEAAAGAKELQGGIEGLKATGGQLRLPFYYALLAESYDLAGQPREALANIATGMAFLSRNGETWAGAELHRVHGEALARSGQRAEARASFAKAVEAARRVGAAAFERRAAEALERLGGRAQNALGTPGMGQ